MLPARVISFVSNPIFILISLPYFLVIKTTHNDRLAWNWSVYTWFFLFLFVMFVLYGVKRKFFNDIDVSNRKQRPPLYLAGAGLATIYVWGLFLFHGPPVLFITIVGILLGILCGSLVNMKIKASVHVASVSALITGLAAVYGGYFYFLFLLVPVICWARVRIKRHSLHEAIVGGILGSLISLLMYLITRPLLNI